MFFLFLSAATILLPDGAPASGAQAVPLATAHFVHVTGITFARPTEPEAVSPQGWLPISSQTAGRWVILHERGWGDVEITPETEIVRLEPWADVSGSVATPLPDGAMVSYHRVERPRQNDERGTIFWTATARVAEDGSYSLRHVPTGLGSVGVLREAKSDRRVLRWRDYPRMVDVPSAGPLNLEGGVAVTGRIVTGDMPALITLAPKKPEATCHGLTDDEGHFSIPGVLPGAYRLTARPDHGSATQNIPHRDIAIGSEPLDLGELSSTDPDVETDTRVEFDDRLIARIHKEAARQSSQPIEKTWIGEILHPSGLYGARITFQPEPDPGDPTKAIRQTLVIHIPGEPIRNYYPEHDSLGYGFRFNNGPFDKVTMFDAAVRVFPLASTTLHLPLDGDVAYEDALALLLAIESNAIGSSEPVPRRSGSNTWTVGPISVGGKPSADILPSILGLRAEKDGTFTIRTRTRPFGGRVYHFKKLPVGGFEFRGGGSWVL
jgi:hypothetical protein